MKYKTVKEFSEIWGLKPTSITYLCRNGKIPGAIKTEKSWMIPENTEKPQDGRHSTSLADNNLLPLPIGLSNFKEAVSEFYYVDKTLLIKDIIDALPKVSLFTRPRRFGKTLTMDMIKVFF